MDYNIKNIFSGTLTNNMTYIILPAVVRPMQYLTLIKSMTLYNDGSGSQATGDFVTVSINLYDMYMFINVPKNGYVEINTPFLCWGMMAMVYQAGQYPQPVTCTITGADGFVQSSFGDVAGEEDYGKVRSFQVDLSHTDIGTNINLIPKRINRQVVERAKNIYIKNVMLTVDNTVENIVSFVVDGTIFVKVIPIDTVFASNEKSIFININASCKSFEAILVSGNSIDCRTTCLNI